MVEAAAGEDSLTTIRGIGPVMQFRLHDAGIRSFAQLAVSTPEDLRKILGARSQLANVDDWIAQARELTRQG